MSIPFDALIKPLTREDFLKNYYGIKPFLSKNNNFSEELISWNEFEEAVNFPFFWEQSTTKIVESDGYYTTKQQFPHERYIDISQSLSNGCSFMLKKFTSYNKKIHSLAIDLENTFGGFINSYLFYSDPKQTSFPVHSDPVHTYIFMAQGKKRWLVYDQFSEFPKQGPLEDVDIKNKLTISLDFIMEPGDFLYIPPYLYHEAKPVTPCLLLSLGEFKSTYNDFLKFLFCYVGNHTDLLKYEVSREPAEHYQISHSQLLKELEMIACSEEFIAYFRSKMETLKTPPWLEVSHS